MSSPSMASSSTSRDSWSGEYGNRKSPIPYRIGPLEYEPPVFCRCGKKAALWISWSDDHPGRRYLKCYRSRMGGCAMLEWFDGPLGDPFVKSLLVDLRDAVWSLKRERAQLKEAHADAVRKLQQQQESLEDVMKFQKKQMLAEAVLMLKNESEQVKKAEKPEKWMRVLIGLSVALAVFVFFIRLG